MANRGKMVVIDLDVDVVFYYGPIDEWAADNSADRDLVRKVNKLKVGEALRDGGGADPLHLIARLA